MLTATVAAVLGGERPKPAHEIVVGFIYWLCVLLLLQPGNVWRSLQLGYELRWDQEVLRIAAASALGAMATPLLLAQCRRYWVGGPRWRVHLAVHAMGCGVVSALLIAASCVLANWMLVAETRPVAEALRWELGENWALLVFCIGAFIAAAHAVRAPGDGVGIAARPPTYLSGIPVRERGTLTLVSADDIDWIETQGNYVSLHVGGREFLVRDTLLRLEPLLDPAKFVRAHRRALVAVNRIASVTSLGSGDASLRLTNGKEVRVSRTHREKLEALLTSRLRT